MNELITQKEQLINYFLNSCCSQENLKVGAEFEKLGVIAPSGKAIPYQGEKGVTSVLSQLSQKFQWKPIKEDNKVIALSRKGTWITLEPGGQVELSSAVFDDTHQIKEELENHIWEIKSVSNPLGIKWLGLGVQPVSLLKDISWVPKNRYQIMVPYMARHGKISHHMMKMTASIQVNIDYTDEQDFAEKMRTALVAVPVVTAIFANSPISEGQLNGFLSKRAYIWNYTDPARCGLIGKKFFSNPKFFSYVEYALQVPMFFIKRGSQWIELENINFSDYLKNGYQNYRATMDDWKLHLSTVFTEVRAKSYIELRCTDCQRMELAPAVIALWKGILYSKEARRAVWFLMKDIAWEDICQLYLTVPRSGLETKLKKMRVIDLAKKLLEISYFGLKEQKQLNDEGEDESIYLEPIIELVTKDEMCPAKVIIKNWEGLWHRNINKLIEYAAH